jgi:subtilisin family serine protease
MRRLLLGAVVAMVAAALTGQAQAGPSLRAGSSSGQEAGQASVATEYLVLSARGASAAAVQAAIEAAGGTVVAENRAVGLATVRTANPGFLEAVTARSAVRSAMASRPVGQVPQERFKPDPVSSDRASSEAAKALARAGGAGPGGGNHAPGSEPLADRQWDMRMIDATPSGSYRVNQGDRGVLVGLIDTGVDGGHPDLKPSFDRRRSRNFTTDIPAIDGPCEVPSCVDPVDVDENGHGTHVAGIIAGAINGLGTAGVAPKVTLVSLRAAQDSGFVFLQSVVNALTYAGDIGVDVVNMSFYIDPWLFNCLDNPADSPAERQEQRTVREATQRALDYARAHGVLPVNALGNQHTNLDNPTTDNTSPDFPPGSERPRTVDNSCLNVPVESDGVVSVAALGPSGRKAFYSNWGPDQADLSAPGGDARDFFGTNRYQLPSNQVLSTLPRNVAIARGDLNPDGTPSNPLVLRDCKGGTCAYYQYLSGTSMAAPHATGVAALVVSAFGHRDREHGGLTLAPALTERILRRTATQTPCPVPALFDYPDPDLSPAFDALCVGTLQHNGFYGDGVVNALSASLR